MAKKSIIAREHKRERLVEKYAELRKKLKEAGDYEALDKLPRNSSKVRLHNRCKLPAGLRVICANLVSTGLPSEKWQTKEKFPESLNQAGNNYNKE